MSRTISPASPEDPDSLLPPGVRQRMNVTLLEGQGYAMLQARMAGRTTSQIAIEFGIEPSLVEDMITRALREGLSTKRYQELQVGMLTKLMDLDEELNTLNRRLRSKSKLRHTEFPKGAGSPQVLWEEVSNVAEKRKLISERRQNVLAVKAILACDPGEIPSEERTTQMSEIMGAVREVSRELRDEAREVGRLEERAKGPVINIGPEEKK